MPSINTLLFTLFLSKVGTSLTLAAIPAYLLVIGIKDGMATVYGVENLAAIIGTLFLMSIVDKFPKNKVAAASELLGAFALLPLILLDQAGMPALIFYATVSSLLGSTAYSTILGWLADTTKSEAKLTKLNSKISVATQLGLATGPLLAVVILGFASIRWVFILDAITFLMSAILIFKLPKMKAVDSSTPAIAQIKQGLKYCMSHKKIMTYVFTNGIQYYAVAVVNTVFVIIIADRLGGGEQHVSFSQFAFFLGRLLGFSAGLRTSFSTRKSVVAGILIQILSLFLMINVQEYWYFIILMSAFQFGTAISINAGRVGLQTATSSNNTGRVMSFRSMSMEIAGLISYIIVAWALKSYNLENVMTFACLSLLAAIVIPVFCISEKNL